MLNNLKVALDVPPERHILMHIWTLQVAVNQIK